MDLTKQERRGRRRWGVIPRWFELFAICAATIAAGFFGGRETVVRADDPEPTVTVTATATATVIATPEPSQSPSTENKPGPEDSSQDPGVTDPPEPGSVVYLADGEAINSDGDVSVQPVTIRGEHYEKSIRLGCNSAGESAVYSTSGYTRLEAKVGILADSPNAIGSVGSIQVVNAAGNPIGEEVSIRSSRAEDLSVDISGQDQIRITCVMTKSGDESAYYFYSGLGNAALS
ncbi:NPCBM/NEW2 domain-containing protein [Streptomyces sp. NPDC050535]|uniref:NPCBM/NEW2 domain-containing protein n=1 Tax=Streptomyces sp. NPDC050535 TaxID=3365626 RepID=UPI0037A7CEB2